MASPSISSQPKSPPLSYADRAKKAQNIKSPISHRSLAQSIPPPTAINAVSTPPAPSSSAPKPPSIPVDVSHSQNGPPTSTAASPPPTPQTAEAPDTNMPEIMRRPSSDLAAKALSIVAAHTASRRTPVTNIWNLRMEQRAAASAAPSPASQSQLLASQSPPSPSTSTLATDRPPPKSYSSKIPTHSAPNAVHGPSAGHAVHGVTPLAVPPPTDTETWPEVGKSIALTSATESKNESENSLTKGSTGDLVPVSTSTSRKSEKTKWVPIPPEELQAAADALAKASRAQQHSGSRKSQPRRSGNTDSNAQGSGSGSGSAQGPSRIQSASQSRAHSRSESLQSSPHLPRGRRLPGDDAVTGASGYGGHALPERNHKRVPHSGETSPPLQVQPHLQPPPQSIPPAESQQLPVNTNSEANNPSMMGGMVHPVPIYSQGHIQPQANGALPSQYTHPHKPISPHGQHQYVPLAMLPHPSHTSYHTSSGGTPPLPPPTSYPKPRPDPRHSPDSSNIDLRKTECFRCGKVGHNSRVCPEAAVASNSYGGGFNANFIYPAYPMYPYDFTSPGLSQQPYGYWSGHPSQPGSGHHSPSYPPQPHYGATFTQAYSAQQQQRQTHPLRERKRSRGLSTNVNTDEDDAFTVRMPPRPPPPENSFPLAGYFFAGPGVSSSAAAQSVDTEVNVDGARRAGDRPGGVVFGSIGVPGASACPSPTPPLETNGTQGGEGVDEEKPFTKFSIGVAPGETVPISRSRSRTHSTSHSHSGKRSRTATVEDGLVEVKENLTFSSPAGVKVIDLTDATKDLKDVKWEFGTATSTTAATSVHSDEAYSPPKTDSAAAAVTEKSDGEELERKLDDAEPLQPILPSIAGFDSPLRTTLPSSGSSPRQLQMRLQQLSLAGPTHVDEDADAAEAEAFKVKDYGYGFGSGSRGSISPPDINEGPRQDGENAGMVPLPERERDQRNKDKRDMEVPVRHKRGGGYHGGYGQERGGYERGEGRGYVRRGRGMNGFGRGYSRRGVGGYQPPPQRQPPPFSVSPPPTHFQPVVNQMADMLSGFYQSRQHMMATYLPPGYETYVPPVPAAPPASHSTPPVPVPISPISFPLDPTRYYLLGQLEYYLSPQNMAQDFFLRQRMDSRGWVPISLITSFNRVRQLTMDAQLVRDVLMLSTVVQVKGEWVRMVSWEQFVLPDAARSTVEPVEEPHDQSYHAEDGRQGAEESVLEGEREGDGEADVDVDADTEIDDDEEEDVVFVMNREEGSVQWSPERRI